MNLEDLKEQAVSLVSDLDVSSFDNVVELLEFLILKAQERENQIVNGEAFEEFVPDDVYDFWKELLERLEPNSPVLGHVWSDDGEEEVYNNLLVHLKNHPMRSITTIKDLNSAKVYKFIERIPEGYEVDFIASAKENGFGVNVIINNGHLVRAYTRGRHSNGRDITMHMKCIIGEYFSDLEGLGVVDIRGEVLVPYENMDAVLSMNPEIKSPFSAVGSILRPSSTQEEAVLCEFVAYNIYCDNLKFDFLSDKCEFLSSLGFMIPAYKIYTCTKETLRACIEFCVNEFENMLSSYRYYTDGVVFGVDNIELFEYFGDDGTVTNGNIALKVGKWAQKVYSGVIEEIVWKPKKVKKTPVAKVNVLTESGNTVTSVPLYAPCYILMLDAYVGNTIYFKYGGEAGVVPCFPDGRLVTDNNNLVEDMEFSDNYNYIEDDWVELG